MSIFQVVRASFRLAMMERRWQVVFGTDITLNFTQATGFSRVASRLPERFWEEPVENSAMFRPMAIGSRVVSVVPKEFIKRAAK